MKLKKVAAIFAACVMGMSMVACGGNDTGSTDSGETTAMTVRRQKPLKSPQRKQRLRT